MVGSERFKSHWENVSSLDFTLYLRDYYVEALISDFIYCVQIFLLSAYLNILNPGFNGMSFRWPVKTLPSCKNDCLTLMTTVHQVVLRVPLSTFRFYCEAQITQRQVTFKPHRDHLGRLVWKCKGHVIPGWQKIPTICQLLGFSGGER